jgi:hypothetical protein
LNLCRYTSSKDGKTVYAIVLFWPQSNVLNLGAPEVSSHTNITLIGYDKDVDIDVSSLYKDEIVFKKLTFKGFFSLSSGSFHRLVFKLPCRQNRKFLVIGRGSYDWVTW